MDLVVGEEPEPGVDALLSYARRSGFSPQALQKLFGPDTGPTAGMAPGVTPASGSAQPPAPTPAAVLGVALPAEVQQRSSDPAVLSMAAWIGGRAGTSATGVRSLHAAASSSSPSAPVSERIDLVGAPVLRTAAAESPATGGLPASVAAASSAAATQPAGAFAATVTVPGDASPASHADLAHRLAQATATRMVAELRQGNGSLRLQIEPASLGKVDIDMTLRQGSLEATLVAHQPVTRELLADALPRLRETLAQLGMNVAGVDIRSGFNGQNDGKSTKQQNREIWYSARRGSVVEPTSPVDGGDQRRSSKLDLWA
jgi:flagellar hook-length control protein FliK